MLKKPIAALSAFLLLLPGCGIGQPGESEAPPAASLPAPSSSAVLRESPPSPQPSRSQPPTPPEEPEPGAVRGEVHPYLCTLVEGIAKEIVRPGMPEYERAKAAFDYLIDHSVIGEPVGLELWRVHGGGEEPIPFLEQRALSPLRFGVGMCEDYAAALTLLLRGVGLSAEYVPGLTYSSEGHLVDHAWTLVQIDGTWYHLDSQLEDNVSRRGTVRYRYFLRGDASLYSSHRWGQNLIDSGLLSEQQNAEIEEGWLLPSCPQDYPTPQQRAAAPDSTLGRAAIRERVQAEIAAYEEKNGPLSPMKLNTAPPVFGFAGYGPADEG